VLHAEEDATSVDGLNLVVSLLVGLGDARDRVAAYDEPSRVDSIVYERD